MRIRKPVQQATFPLFEFSIKTDKVKRIRKEPEKNVNNSKFYEELKTKIARRKEYIKEIYKRHDLDIAMFEVTVMEKMIDASKNNTN